MLISRRAPNGVGHCVTDAVYSLLLVFAYGAFNKVLERLRTDRGWPHAGRDLGGVTSDRKLVMELQCNMALRWFVGLNLDEQPWDASTFSQNRRRRFDESGILERLFDETVAKAMMEGLGSRHVSADGTLIRANASYKSFVPIEVAMAPEEYKRRLRAEDRPEPTDPPDPGNPAVNFRGEKRGKATHRSTSDPDCRFVSKGTSGTGAYPGYTVNALMENRHRIRLGLDAATFRSTASETTGCLGLLDHAHDCWGFTPTTLGADKGFFTEDFIEALLDRDIEPRIAVDPRALRAGPTAGCGSACADSATSCRNGAARRSRNCSVRARTGMASAGSAVGASTESARRPI